MDLSAQDPPAPQFTSSSVRSWWKTSSEIQKLDILSALGMIETERQELTLQKSKGKQLRSSGSHFEIEILESIQLEFNRWNAYLQGHPEANLILSSMKFSETLEWIDVEAPFDKPESQQTVAPELETSIDKKFLEWCISQEDIGSGLCEFLAFCSLYKLFSTQMIHPDQAEDNQNKTRWNRCSWAALAFSKLEQTYQQQVGDETLISLFARTPARNPKKRNSGRKSKEKLGEFHTEETLGKQSAQLKTKEKRIPKSKSKCSEIPISGSEDVDNSCLTMQETLQESIVNPHTENHSNTDTNQLEIFSSEINSMSPPHVITQRLSDENSQSDSEDSQTLSDPPHLEQITDDLVSCILETKVIFQNEIKITPESEFPVQKQNFSNLPETIEQSEGLSDTSQNCVPSEQAKPSPILPQNVSSQIDLIKWDNQQRLPDLLTQDILDMAGNLHKIAQLRRPWQLAAIERVRVIVQSIWPQAQCDIFGSFGTGLAIPSSDVDIVVTGVPYLYSP
jgi:hypothetical protein